MNIYGYGHSPSAVVCHALRNLLKYLNFPHRIYAIYIDIDDNFEGFELFFIQLAFICTFKIKCLLNLIQECIGRAKFSKSLRYFAARGLQ